ncbi:MAG TPA: type I-C CRISPR-associated endonuclease Cas1 [Candidatus Aphodovivens avistercoris]|nr:type I-C CRISPR-associated endonuclease Cas1 [Candidatus Aphodovivens avistercoris]
MRRLLNTLYVFTENAYLALDGENVVVKAEGKEIGRIPLHTLESIASFSYRGASPALMGKCVECGVALNFFDRKGRFLAAACGESKGNVLLRKAQYEASNSEEKSLAIARNFIVGKLFNSRWVLERAIRDHSLRIDVQAVSDASGKIKASIDHARTCGSLETLRGIEGDAAAEYFGVFGELILRDKEAFGFGGRVRRPPTDPVNAMLSLFYTVLSRDCASALEGVGLDSYVGLLHADRPGRQSLALDLMEELRSVFVDRFVLSAINNRIAKPSHFVTRETGEVRISDEGRKALFGFWQDRKKEPIVHPFIKEKMPRGLVPHIQARLLAKCIRGDLDGYPPFLWK